MVLTRSQIRNLSREELIEGLLQLSDISIQLKALIDRFDTFAARNEELESDLLIIKNCSTLLHRRIIGLERNAVNNTRYHRREPLEVNLVPGDLGDNVLEETIDRITSSTGHEITPDDLHVCHKLKNQDRLILKFTQFK